MKYPNMAEDHKEFNKNFIYKASLSSLHWKYLFGQNLGCFSLILFKQKMN